MSRTLLAVALAAVVAAAPAQAAGAADATASGSAEATASGSADPSSPSVLAVPPATAGFDVAPVIALVPEPAALRAPVSPLIASTGSVDGALTVDEGQAQKQYTLAGDVFFEPTSAELTERARTDLTELAARLAEESPSAVAVVGHTDDVDTDEYNQTLSERRAEAVRTFLAQAGDLPVTSEGRGEGEPVATNKTDEGRALNRRVEITAQIG